MKKTKTLTAFVLACFAVIAAVVVIAGKSKKADAAEATQYIYRISGESRYETAIKVADELKNYTGVSRFDSVVIASGLSFPDALAGSYLAIKKDAPILLIANNQKYIDMVSSYVKENLNSNGTVYILGGEGAVSAECEAAFSDFNVERLSGSGRIETNLAILEEAGVTDEDILVCTAGGFPDSLSASATGRPILLVGRSLTAEQKEWLASLEGNGNKFYIIGGTGVVGTAVENEIKAYADEVPTRLAGSDRFNTSILIAEEFFPSAHGMTLAYSHNFPDGLSGGPLAAACGFPLILTQNKFAAYKPAVEYREKMLLWDMYVLGGTSLISNTTASKIYGYDQTPELPAGTVKVPTYSFEGATLPANNEATLFAHNMRMGWNLGNTFDSNGSGLSAETYWQPDKTTDALIEKLYNAGFRTIRIPVTWNQHLDNNGKIDEAWLNRVQEVVDYAYGRGMYVILNTHHDIDEDYIWPTADAKTQSINYLNNIWSQLCVKFKDYDEHLIFEVMNEPRVIGDTHEWYYVSSCKNCNATVDAINEINQAVVNTVRASGGNNADRYIMVGSTGTSSETVLLDRFKLPTDTAQNKLLVSVHIYANYDLTQNYDKSSRTTFTQTDSNETLNYMKKLYNKYTSKGIPVVMGEFGCINKGNASERYKFYSYNVGCAANYGIVPVVWDNNAHSGWNNNFGLIKRSTLRWDDWNIILSMMQYYYYVDTSILSGTGQGGAEYDEVPGIFTVKKSEFTGETIYKISDSNLDFSQVYRIEADIYVDGDGANGAIANTSKASNGWEYEKYTASSGYSTVSWDGVGGKAESGSLCVYIWWMNTDVSEVVITAVRLYDSDGSLLKTISA